MSERKRIYKKYVALRSVVLIIRFLVTFIKEKSKRNRVGVENEKTRCHGVLYEVLGNGLKMALRATV